MDASRSGGLAALIARQARDFAAWPVRGERFADEIACLAAVLLAIGTARALGIGNVGWAAFSAYIVIRPGLGESLYRGVSRVLGTALGVTLACVLAPVLLRSTAWLSAGLALFGAATLYLALVDRRTYGCLFAGMAFAIVLIDGMEHADEALGALARTRLLDVCVGSAAALLARAVATGIAPCPPGAGASRTPAARRMAPRYWHPLAFMHSLQGALALALIPWVWTAFHVRSLSQSSTTILAVMMVPVLAADAASGPASRKMRHRFIGCGIGALLATSILMLSHAAPAAMLLAVCAGVVAGRHIENGALDISYVGTQFALAFLVVLVPDGHAAADLQSGVSRLLGILVGMALLEPVRLLFKTCFPPR